MEIYKSIRAFPALSHTVVTGGSFDGMHIGHREIIRHVISAAQQAGGQSVAYTFSPHPRHVLSPAANFSLLATEEEKLAAFEKMGIDYALLIPFTPTFAAMSYTQFIEDVLVNTLRVKKIVVGYDHQFGKNRAGGIEQLAEASTKFHFGIEKIPACEADGVAVSSTKIRNALATVESISIANRYLGAPYSLSGEVAQGNHLGKKIGFPTANISILHLHKLIPAVGVYAVTAQVGSTFYKGMCYIGHRPTLQGKTLRIEVNLFDFHQDESLYGKTLKLFFHHPVRGETKFASIEQMKQQLSKDKEKSIELLQHVNPYENL